MTFLISMLFVAAIAFSLITIAGSFTSSWSRMAEIIENEYSDAVSAPTIHIGEPRHYIMPQVKIINRDNIIIDFPRKTVPTSLKAKTVFTKAA